jgi:hypothetical protein
MKEEKEQGGMGDHSPHMHRQHSHRLTDNEEELGDGMKE